MDRVTKDEITPKIVSALLNSDTDISLDDALENDMILSMGPQHPATHGVLRLLLRLDGETIMACVPEVGYLHRGYEKMAENMSFTEYIPHTDRLDYLSPPANNSAYALAVEKLLGIEAPPRAQYIRMMMMEFSRICSHLVAIGSLAMDIGALTVFLWTLREREKVLNFYDEICGARFTTSYTRIGGVAQDVKPETFKGIKQFLDEFESNIHEFEKLLNTNKIFIQRLEGIGQISAEDAIDIGLSGPNLRACGVEFDLRRATPYYFYNDIDFKVVTFSEGDALARYFVRCDELRESRKIIYQILDKMPNGEIMLNSPKKVTPRKVEIYTKMEELIHDFMITNFGVNPPIGEIYSAVENPKGELGFYIVSNGEGHPWKMKIRSPSFCNIQSLPLLTKGYMISDVVAIIGSIDPVMGEADK